MSTADLLTLWSDQLALSIVIWLFVLIVLMYFARQPAHSAIRSFSKVIRNSMRLGARSTMLAEERLKERNKEVLIAAGREATERYIEREFQRVENVVGRDLSGYPSLHRELKEQIINIDSDYRESSEVPPSPPAWVKAVEAVAKIPSNGDPMVSKILGDIQTTINNVHNTAMQEYRNSCKERHMLLKKMMPYWRKLEHSLSHVESKILSLEKRSKIIDQQIEKYEAIMAKTDTAVRMLSSSSMTQFFISAIVLSIALLGGLINFQLIALPFSEMVGANTYIGDMRAADVAALFLVLMETALGIFLMDALGITRLFPIIHSMDDKLRRKMIWAVLTFLFIFACIESSLAYMRDFLAADREALTQSLAGVAVEKPEFRWIPSMGQMTMGFILPFALAFVAIPLESFIHSSRTVIGVALVGVLHGVAFILRLTGNLANSMGNVVISVYDLIIFLPLRIGQSFRQRKFEEDLDETRMLGHDADNARYIASSVSSGSSSPAGPRGEEK